MKDVGFKEEKRDAYAKVSLEGDAWWIKFHTSCPAWAAWSWLWRSSIVKAHIKCYRKLYNLNADSRSMENLVFGKLLEVLNLQIDCKKQSCYFSWFDIHNLFVVKHQGVVCLIVWNTLHLESFMWYNFHVHASY